MLAENIKGRRVQAGLSQEQLAEQLQVSRQAVTKWETGAGIPDIENLRAIAVLFGITLDELLGDVSEDAAARGHLHESVTEYDIDGEKRFDITFAGAASVVVEGCDSEKVRVELASDTIPDVQRVCKVKIDDIRKRIDIDVKRLEGLSETKAKEGLRLTVRFPQRYVDEVELAGNAVSLAVRHLAAERFEFSGRLSAVELDDVSGHVELNCNDDLDIRCVALDGRLDVNQLSATSKLRIAEGTPFESIVRGIGNHILYQRAGAPCDDFSLHGDEATACTTVIELNGMRSELTISVDAPGA
ncbi:helix-turn-helix transcriptional regulator [Gordonibacter sp.]|uniref:helix-turn-helix domain-containing protein n=1 Tax=Gordonibacter sp. TaxID=1968902 RepID=UPI0025C67CB8|nr:helix-turn-helix transcriptional regulator [Gordonibacter sp.]